MLHTDDDSSSQSSHSSRNSNYIRYEDDNMDQDIWSKLQDALQYCLYHSGSIMNIVWFIMILFCILLQYRNQMKINSLTNEVRRNRLELLNALKSNVNITQLHDEIQRLKQHISDDITDHISNALNDTQTCSTDSKGDILNDIDPDQKNYNSHRLLFFILRP